MVEAIETDIETAGTGQQKQEREQQVDDIYKDLKLKHNTIPQLRLWSKWCVQAYMRTWTNCLAFGLSVKKPHRESLVDAIIGSTISLFTTKLLLYNVLVIDYTIWDFSVRLTCIGWLLTSIVQLLL